jgi:undecaprenyl-diphosphatase
MILPVPSVSISHAIIFGVVQALTEFLPISSSGHLILVSNFLGSGSNPLIFDVFLHLGTAAALLIVFYKDLFALAKALYFDFFLKKFNFGSYTTDGKMALYLAMACIPAVLVGLLFGDSIDANYREVSFVIKFSIFGTLLMILAELVAQYRGLRKDVSGWSATIIGVLQSFALFPGVSRSGSTISAGMLLGISRQKAARFSFLMSVPLIFAATGYEFYSSIYGSARSMYISGFLVQNLVALLFGFLSSFIVGIFAIKFLLKFLENHSLWVFIIYRIGLVLVLLSVIN